MGKIILRDAENQPVRLNLPSVESASIAYEYH